MASRLYIGHTPALKRTRKDVEIYLRDYYCGLTVDEFLAEQEAWIDEETTKAINQMNIDYQADHVSDKVSREVKPCDDNDDVFELLPELDELNDVENFDDELILPTCELDEKIFFTPIGNEFCNITVADECVHFFNGKLFLIRSPKYRARWKDGYFFAILGDIVKPCDSDEEFFAEMAKRGACTIDKPEPPVDTDLERKIKIEDSLRRAMEIATAEQERFLRLAATSYNKGTRKDCFREADNELKLYNICWQATNELWSERW